MSVDELVQEVVQQLQKADRMDAQCEGVLPDAHPARRAVSGISAAVWACSQPRCSSSLGTEFAEGSDAAGPGGAKCGSTTLGRSEGGD
ncbi:hypothetical protein NDU88_006311 [Pleurodeles waltl]|uniref:Uncharacterized protein n=1 Tax=Pleurodeles waltl TaxID=8319 RepID=A0AAV7WX88_PLEWA|nr:hypothetical protein NDU88_006311 [Pleurodeles waltl]